MFRSTACSHVGMSLRVCLGARFMFGGELHVWGRAPSLVSTTSASQMEYVMTVLSLTFHCALFLLFQKLTLLVTLKQTR